MPVGFELLSLAGWLAAIGALASAARHGRALRARAETVAYACHELRGPLTAVWMGLEQPGQGGLGERRRRAMLQELEKASLVVGDLEAGRIHSPRIVQTERLDALELVMDCVEAWTPWAQARGAELRMSWAGPPAIVPGQRLRLAQVLGNLIANAIEHGKPPVDVRGRRDRDVVRLEVRDRGPGLRAPVAELAAGRRGPRAARGRGLRVALSIVAEHGGRLAAAPSELGARVVLELPAPSDASASVLPAPGDCT